MADLNQEELGDAGRLTQPAEKECEMLGKTEGREEALREEAEEKKEEEPKLPKLSAAEFRAYNSMAEHMDYFVSAVQLFSSNLDLSLSLSIL
jgi:hypothetical protein